MERLLPSQRVLDEGTKRRAVILFPKSAPKLELVR